MDAPYTIERHSNVSTTQFHPDIHLGCRCYYPMASTRFQKVWEWWWCGGGVLVPCGGSVPDPSHHSIYHPPDRGDSAGAEALDAIGSLHRDIRSLQAEFKKVSKNNAATIGHVSGAIDDLRRGLELESDSVLKALTALDGKTVESFEASPRTRYRMKNNVE